MSSKRKVRRLSRSSQDYKEEQLYAGRDDQGHDRMMRTKKHWPEKDYQGGVYSDSLVGGPSQSQQNPWQGAQEMPE